MSILKKIGTSWWSVCILFCFGIPAITLTVMGAEQFSKSNEWENSVRDECHLTSYEYQSCIYSCGDEGCEGDMVLMYATINQTCPGMIFKSQDTFECNKDFDDYDYEIGEEYDCWIKSDKCSYITFTLIDHKAEKSGAVTMLVFGILLCVPSLFFGGVWLYFNLIKG